MNQCVPNWHFEENSTQSVDYEVAELTWEKGQLAMHGLGIPRVVNKPTASSSPTTWDKPRAGGTLESIVNQANCHPQPKSAADGGGDNTDEVVPWFEGPRTAVKPAAAPPTTMDALVPCNLDTSGNDSQERGGGAGEPRVGINSGCRTNGSMSESGTCGGSQDYTKTSADDHDSISHSKSQASHNSAHSTWQRETGDEEGKRKLSIGQSSVSTKRSRAAAIHNQSERKRRDKINQRMKTLQKLVPNSSKTDKASMLDEVIEYLKQLQAQINMMSRMNMSSMMLPLMQQQLQMSMMGMGMGMGVMDMNTINRAAATAVPPVIPQAAAFMPASWDNPADRLPTPPAGPVMPDPLAALLACQSQPITMDAYSRLAAMYQQMQLPPPSQN